MWFMINHMHSNKKPSKKNAYRAENCTVRIKMGRKTGFKHPLNPVLRWNGIHDSLWSVHHGYILTIHHKLHSLRASPSVSSSFSSLKYFFENFSHDGTFHWVSETKGNSMLWLDWNENYGVLAFQFDHSFNNQNSSILYEKLHQPNFIILVRLPHSLWVIEHRKNHVTHMTGYHHMTLTWSWCIIIDLINDNMQFNITRITLWVMNSRHQADNHVKTSLF